MSISGRLMPYLWLIVGATLTLTGASNADGGRWFLLGPGVVCLAVTAGIWRVDWRRVPVWFVRTLVGGGVTLLGVVGAGAPHSDRALIVTTAIAMMWTGIALDLSDLAGVSLMCGAAIMLPQLRQYPTSTALWHTLEDWLLVTACGAAMHWLRRQMDAGALAAARAQAQASGVQAQALLDREQAVAEQSRSATAELAERTRLQAQVAEETTALAEASSAVRSQTMSVATATEQMSHALAELTRTAQATDQITTGVAAKAHDASDVMRALKTSSAEIMAASDVIQAIAEQTNLLALNATIESARAGEAGRGFAVVANEVKDLARQSGENADSITRTLAEVQIQVSAAVDRVTEITTSMGELSAHNGALAAAIEEQSASVHQVSQSVQQTARQVSTMADGIQALERISRVS